MMQELRILPEHLCSSPVLSGVGVAQSLRFLCNILFFFACPLYCMFFCDLRLPFGIFKYFLNLMYNIKQTKTKTSRYQRVNQNP